MDVENPLHKESLPVATLVKVHVEIVGENLTEWVPWVYWFEQIWDCVSFISAILFLLGMFGGILYMLVWMYSAF